MKPLPRPSGRGLSCGFTVRTSEKWPYTVSFSDAFARALDKIQYTADDGPCLRDQQITQLKNPVE